MVNSPHFDNRAEATLSPCCIILPAHLYPDDVPPPDLCRVRREPLLPLGVGAGVRHHLQLQALATEVVEDQLGPGFPREKFQTES